MDITLPFLCYSLSFKVDNARQFLAVLLERIRLVSVEVKRKYITWLFQSM
jgi:hypothetical protein